MHFNLEQFKVIFHENWQLVSHLLKVNEQAVENYFEKLDFEVYYGDKKKVSPVGYLKQLYKELAAEKGSSSETREEEAQPEELQGETKDDSDKEEVEIDSDGMNPQYNETPIV